MSVPNKGNGLFQVVTNGVKHSTDINNFGSSCIDFPSGNDHYLT